MLWGSSDFADGVHLSTTIDDEMTHETFQKLNRIGCADGDFDCDGDFDLFDFARFQECFGQPVAVECEPGDMDANGVIDLEDYSILAALFVDPQ